MFYCNKRFVWVLQLYCNEFIPFCVYTTYILLPSGIVYKFIFSEKNLNNLCYYFNSQAVWTIKY